MVFSVNQAQEWEGELPPRTSGIYLTVSDDLIKWSEQFPNTVQKLWVISVRPYI